MPASFWLKFKKKELKQQTFFNVFGVTDVYEYFGGFFRNVATHFDISIYTSMSSILQTTWNHIISQGPFIFLLFKWIIYFWIFLL